MNTNTNNNNNTQQQQQQPPTPSLTYTRECTTRRFSFRFGKQKIRSDFVSLPLFCNGSESRAGTQLFFSGITSTDVASKLSVTIWKWDKALLQWQEISTVPMDSVTPQQSSNTSGGGGGALEYVHSLPKTNGESLPLYRVTASYDGVMMNDFEYVFGAGNRHKEQQVKKYIKFLAETYPSYMWHLTNASFCANFRQIAQQQQQQRLLLVNGCGSGLSAAVNNSSSDHTVPPPLGGSHTAQQGQLSQQQQEQVPLLTPMPPPQQLQQHPVPYAPYNSHMSMPMMPMLFDPMMFNPWMIPYATHMMPHYYSTPFPQGQVPMSMPPQLPQPSYAEAGFTFQSNIGSSSLFDNDMSQQPQEQAPPQEQQHMMGLLLDQSVDTNSAQQQQQQQQQQGEQLEPQAHQVKSDESGAAPCTDLSLDVDGWLNDDLLPNLTDESETAQKNEEIVQNAPVESIQHTPDDVPVRNSIVDEPPLLLNHHVGGNDSSLSLPSDVDMGDFYIGDSEDFLYSLLTEVQVGKKRSASPSERDLLEPESKRMRMFWACGTAANWVYLYIDFQELCCSVWRSEYWTGIKWA